VATQRKNTTTAWEQRKLGDYAIIKGRLGWKSLKQEEYTDSGPSMIAGRHIKHGNIQWKLVDHIPEWRYEESPEIALRNDDVIFSKDGSLGNPALIHDLTVETTINSTMMLVRTDSSFYSAFLYEELLSESFERLIYLKVSGSSIPHLFQADMKNFKISVPILEEQTMIAKILLGIDNLIAANEDKHKQ